MRAIVTGGAGFIGSHVAAALLARGDEVHALDDLSKGKLENVPEGATLHEADIRGPDEVFDSVRPEAIFHLAAQADVRTSVERPDYDADVNVLGTLRVLEGARRHDAQVVFASTGGAIYGECDGPAPETAERRDGRAAAVRRDSAGERRRAGAELRRRAARRAPAERARRVARRTRARLAAGDAARRRAREDVGVDRAGVERAGANRFARCST